MLLFAAAMIATPSVTTASPQRQARATVRIMRAEPIRFAEIESQQPQRLRSTMVLARDGSREPVRLLEHE